jgi:diguanylate cyclase (GGDEF)-like protein/PAS domain S-box-containing protein
MDVVVNRRPRRGLGRRGADGVAGGAEDVEMQRRIRMAFERSPVAMTIRDIGGEIALTNEAFATMIGRTLDETLRLTSAEYVHPEDVARFVAVSDQFRSGALATYTGSIRYLRPDGSVVYGHFSSNVIDDETGRPAQVFSLIVDLTTERNLLVDLAEAERRFRAAFDNAPTGMALVGLDGRFIEANETLCGFLGYGADELLQRTFQELTHPDDLDADVAYVDRLTSGQIASYQMEKRYFTSRGDVVWALLSVALVRGDDGTPLHFISHVKDISDDRRRQEELELLAERDPLTGVLNRRRFTEELVHTEARVADGEATGAVVVIDLDDLKAVNDRVGHEGGDRFIVRVAAVATDEIGPADRLARFGGDEFVVLLPDTDGAQARQVAERVRRAVAQPDGTQTVSIGVAMIDATAPGRSLSRADAAMYQAKRAGGNRVIGPSGDLRAVGAEERSTAPADPDRLRVDPEPTAGEQASGERES